MMTRVHLAILWTGARIVCESDRAEWRAEWQTELWYAMEDGGRGQLTSFCLGSWRDALWKRKNAGIGRRHGSVLMIADRPGFPEPPAIECAHPLESPFRCLALLGLLALVAMFVSLSGPEAPLSGGKLLVGLFPLCAIFWPVVAVTSGAGGSEYAHHRNWFRRGCFCGVKMALLLLIVAFGASDLTGLTLRINVACLGAFLAIRWARLDQQRRCPNCLRLLDKPVRMGSGSRILLEWNGTELLCRRGHGVMHVPEMPAIWFRRPRWMSLGY
jgi:hypothetical protein